MGALPSSPPHQENIPLGLLQAENNSELAAKEKNIAQKARLS